MEKTKRPKQTILGEDWMNIFEYVDAVEIYNIQSGAGHYCGIFGELRKRLPNQSDTAILELYMDAIHIARALRNYTKRYKIVKDAGLL